MSKSNYNIEKTLKELEKIKNDPDKVDEYEARAAMLKDVVSRIDEAREEAREEARDKIKKEFIQKMVKRNNSIKDIADILEITDKEVEQIINNIKKTEI